MKITTEAWICIMHEKYEKDMFVLFYEDYWEFITMTTEAVYACESLEGNDSFFISRQGQEI